MTSTDSELDWASALRESEQRFRTATEAVSDILWTNNAAGEMQGEQPGWSAFTGQSFEEYQGYGWSSALHPEDAPRTIAAWEEAVRERRRFAFEHRLRRRDGVYRLCRIRALPVPNEDGTIREWVGVHTDVTDERDNQEKLRETIKAVREQQELMEAAQLVTQVGFWRYQPLTDEVYLSTGARELLGLPREVAEPTIQEAVECIDPEDISRVQQAFEDSRVTGQCRVEFRTRARSNGEPRWLLCAARTLTSKGGDIYYVGMILDITQQKRSAEAMVRTEKLVVAGRLAASIAHEINNPLEAVTNLLYLLMETRLNAEQQAYAQTMQVELERISHIATHTLRFHRQSTRATKADVAGLLNSVLALNEGRMRNADVETELRYRSRQTVMGYEGELRQIFANLVGNAVDAMNGTAGVRRLHLRTCATTNAKTGERGLRVTIADTGTGMDRETLNHMFDAFYTTKADIGTGLGLWVSMELLSKNGGALRVRSSQDEAHRGTVFRMFLPLDTGDAEASASDGARRRQLSSV